MARLQKTGGPLFTTSISVFEITEGIRNEKESTTAKEFFSSIEVLAMARKQALLAGQIRKGLKQKGITIEVANAMIAGIALSANQTVLTRNVKDFSHVKSLKVETY